MKVKLNHTPGDNRLVIPPKDGWKQQTWYIVNVSFGSHNPVQSCLFFTGFINEDGTPGGYNGFVSSGYSDGSNAEYHNAYYLEAVEPVCRINNRGRLVK